MRTWSTPEVAKLTGVTARALRHYDTIGLLPPAGTGHGGLRRYGQAELLRLQQILLLKRLGLRLDVIAEILAGNLTELDALHRHAAQLDADRTRLDRLAATVTATIRQLEGGTPMTPETWFSGLEPDAEAAHRDQARRRWGQQVVEQAWTALQDMTAEQRREIGAASTAINTRLAGLRDTGQAPDAPEVQAAIGDHHRLTARHWPPTKDATTPNASAYKRLADLYTEDPRFTDTFNEVAPGFAAFLAEAMTHYADTRL